MKNTVKMPGLVLVGIAVAAFAIGLYGFDEASTTLGIGLVVIATVLLSHRPTKSGERAFSVQNTPAVLPVPRLNFGPLALGCRSRNPVFESLDPWPDTGGARWKSPLSFS